MEFAERWPLEFFAKLALALIAFFLILYCIHRLQNFIKEKRKKLFLAQKVVVNAEIRAILAKVVESKERLRVKINERSRSYNSLLLDVSPSTILIDTLFPRDGNERVRKSKKISVDFSVRDAQNESLFIPYIFESTYVRDEVYNDYPAVRIAFPTFLRRDQRRSFHRVDPPVNEPIFVCFELDGARVMEKIANISGGGIGFYTNYSKTVLWLGRQLDIVDLELPGYSVVSCFLTVHTLRQVDQPVFIDGKPLSHYCGAEFGGIDRDTREQIVQYVIAKEREALKRISRGYS